MTVLVSVCCDLTFDAIIGINLLQQEQLIFNAAFNQVNFSAAKGSHRGWKQAQIVITTEMNLNVLEACQ
jgi:hypothetical protein